MDASSVRCQSVCLCVRVVKQWIGGSVNSVCWQYLSAYVMNAWMKCIWKVHNRCSRSHFSLVCLVQQKMPLRSYTMYDAHTFNTIESISDYVNWKFCILSWCWCDDENVLLSSSMFVLHIAVQMTHSANWKFAQQKKVSQSLFICLHFDNNNATCRYADRHLTNDVRTNEIRND